MQQWLSQTPNSLHQDGGIQRFAAALPLQPPGSVRLADPERNLPSLVYGRIQALLLHGTSLTVFSCAYFICSLQLSCTISPFKSALSREKITKLFFFVKTKNGLPIMSQIKVSLDINWVVSPKVISVTPICVVTNSCTSWTSCSS